MHTGYFRSWPPSPGTDVFQGPFLGDLRQGRMPTSPQSSSPMTPSETSPSPPAQEDDPTRSKSAREVGQTHTDKTDDKRVHPKNSTSRPFGINTDGKAFKKAGASRLSSPTLMPPSTYLPNASHPSTDSTTPQRIGMLAHDGRSHTQPPLVSQVPLQTTLRKSQSVGKTGKKGLRSRLKKFNHKKSSSSRPVMGVSMTSGESDSEAPLEPEQELMFNSGGLAQKFTPSTKMPHVRPRLPHQDATLPPAPRPSSGSFRLSPVPHFDVGNKNNGSGSGTPKETSTGRFKEMLKNVGRPHTSSVPTPAPVATSPSLFKPVQSRTFPLIGDFLSGDDQPSSSARFSVARLSGTGRRKRRFTKKSLSNEGRALSAMPTDDEDSSAPATGSFNRRDLLHLTHHPHHHAHQHHHHHGFMNLHRRRSRSIGEEGRRENHSVRYLGPPISQTLLEARRKNRDPSLLLVELEPLPAKFVTDFKALSMKSSFQSPLTSTISPSATTGSGTGSTFSGPWTHHRSIMRTVEPLGTKSFLFKSYQNSKFQGHYVFRVVRDQVEYKKLPVTLEHSCSQYFREAYVTYRSLEKKAKQWREEREERKKSALVWSAPFTPEPMPTVRTLSRFARPDDLRRRSTGSDILKSNLALDLYADHQQDPTTSFPVSTLNTSSFQGGALETSPLEKQARRGGGDRRLLGFVEDRAESGSALLGSHTRKRSWSSAREQHRQDLLKRVAEEAQWKELDRKDYEVLKQACYGLELYLSEMIKGSEYERFDAASEVAVFNEKGDTAVFSIVNGDRTNMMWLESPSTKLKNEFLNWIAISVMDRGEPLPKSGSKRDLVGSDSNLDDLSRDEDDRDCDDGDILAIMATIRLSQHEEKLRFMRQEIERIRIETEQCLDQLDALDENAKKLMTTMVRAIDSQEVQLALRPSPTTGLTLAKTVELKLKDVNERIVICTRIMGAARSNLNRLQYEIELEQRSIRLFRQYKIIIAVVTISVVFLVWFLYHSRISAMAPQPASPLFAAPVNPYETAFHHGEMPTLPSPTPLATCNSDPEDVAVVMTLDSLVLAPPPLPTMVWVRRRSKDQEVVEEDLEIADDDEEDNKEEEEKASKEYLASDYLDPNNHPHKFSKGMVKENEVDATMMNKEGKQETEPWSTLLDQQLGLTGGFELGSETELESNHAP